MRTYTRIIYQIIFGTRNRIPALTRDRKEDLFKYISGILEKKNCHLYRINGVEDHIHILTDLNPAISVASLVKDIKVASSLHIKQNTIFPNFVEWQEGYGAFTYSMREKEILIEYIKNQEEHHKKVDFREEYRQILMEHEIEFDEKYLL
jgi:putative transposase